MICRQQTFAMYLILIWAFPRPNLVCSLAAFCHDPECPANAEASWSPAACVVALLQHRHVALCYQPCSMICMGCCAGSLSLACIWLLHAIASGLWRHQHPFFDQAPLYAASRQVPNASIVTTDGDDFAGMGPVHGARATSCLLTQKPLLP